MKTSGLTGIKFFLFFSLSIGIDHRAASAQLFSSDGPMSVKMTADWPALNKLQKGQGFVEGAIEIDGKKMAVRFEPRGEVRRELCPGFPPFRINLPKTKKARLESFTGLSDELKFVTHCVPSGPDMEKEQGFVMAEYAQYRFLGDAGLAVPKARLIDAVYLNADGSEFSRGRGFFIESKKDYAKRNGLKEDSTPSSSLLSLRLRVHFLQALIRNDDYAIYPGEKKGKNLFKVFNAVGEVLAKVSYDFDLGCLTGKQNCAEWPLTGEDGKASVLEHLRSIRSVMMEKTPETEHPEFLETYRRELSNFLKTGPAILISLEKNPHLSEERKRAMRRAIATFFAAAPAVLRD